MTYRGTWTVVHGMLFGGFFLLAAYAMVIELFRAWHGSVAAPMSERGRRLESMYLALTALLGWLAVFSGTYIVYPWYRAALPAGADLHAYPRSLLLASAQTAGLHSLGMEWKEHVAFLAPIAFTMLAWVFARYPSEIRRHPEVRRTLLGFGLAALLATAVPAVVGAFLNKAAPTEGTRVMDTPHAVARLEVR
ncbi:hypothetical protein Terro_4300 [Terriglobus roseus DSM 18391]|uniref:Uncharacterized protein n=1 Tax=Terriglobus roseus (strain DSM 18391 / NRRL B-41598 / KBS 63) TaxID=926566 RepID=I3ZMM9_TERRK|nr:hypothetical protein [Terriglobus roseus]AFL90497.1 hypothetical protein Terro_4300 [Terriglobus roseus DSM 18391]